MRRALALLLAVTMVLLAAGCETAPDDEMVPAPKKTVTRSAPPPPTEAPASVPVGQGEVSADDVVWAQGTVLHVGRRAVDLNPAEVEAFVAVPGGVFVLSRGELWFTDLSRLRPTGLAGVTGLGATADRDRIVVTSTLGGVTDTSAYDTRTGRGVESEGVEVASKRELLGDVSGVEVSRARFSGAVPARFDPVGRAGDARVYGLARAGDRPSAVAVCNTVRRACSRLGLVEATDPVVFGSGR